MTHDDYMTIADSIRSARMGNQRTNAKRCAYNSALYCVSKLLADRFAAKDPAFDRTAFLSATVSSP